MTHDQEIARLEHVIRLQMKEIDEVRAKYTALVEAVQDKFGAHGALVIIYTDPTKPDSLRVKAAAAALPYEKAKPPSAQQHEHFHLFTHLETARLRKKNLQVIDAVKADPGPNAA